MMKVELSEEELGLALKAIKIEMNFCKRSLTHCILPEHRKELLKRIQKYDSLVQKLCKSLEKL